MSEPPEGAEPCTASITSDATDGTVHCVLPAGHEDPEHGNTHAGPGDAFTRLRWFDWAVGATPHQPKPDESAAPEEPPAPAPLEEVQATVEDLRYRIRRAREALAEDEPNEVADLRQAVACVRALHTDEYGSCSHCTRADSVPYPCPTIRALDGEAP